MKKILALALVTALSVSMLAGCGKTTEQDTKEGTKTEVKTEEKAEEKVYNWYSSSDIPSLDTNKATDQASFEVLGNVLEGLFVLGENDVPVNGVAESYEVSDDGLHYTFKLRQDAVWSNGTKVTANDFVYSWRRLTDPKTASEYQFMAATASFKNYEKVMSGELAIEELGVKATDDYTLEVELEVPVPFFVSLITFPNFYPVNQEFVEAQGENFGTSVETTIFNGPFVVSSWEQEYEYVMSKNDTYWNKDVVKTDKIVTRIIKDTATAVNMYETGELDRVGLSAEYVDQYKDTEEFLTYPSSSVFYLEVNQGKEPFNNLNARKAVATAFDKSFITDELLNNGSRVADYLVPQGLAVSPEGKDFREGTGTYNSYDLEVAAAAWEKAKQELGKDTFEVELLTYDNESSRRISEYMQGQLETNLPGLTVTINQQPFKNKLALASAKEFDFNFAGWGPDYADPMTFLDMWLTESGHNNLSYSNPKYDELVIASKSGELASKPVERWAALQESERILLEDDVVLVPLYQKGLSVLMKPYVKGLNYHLFGSDYTYKNLDVQK